MLQIYIYYFKYVYKKVNKCKKKYIMVICCGFNGDKLVFCTL